MSPAGAVAAAPPPARVEDRLVRRLTRCLRAYLRLHAAAGPESPATRLAARALERACEDALAYEEGWPPPAPAAGRGRAGPRPARAARGTTR